MKTLLFGLALLTMTASSPTFTIDFGTDKDGQRWRVVNDGVMGGLSQGKMSWSKNSIMLTGDLSLENNGGFSSIRSADQPFDLSEYSKVKIRARGFGGTFGLTFRTASPYYTPYYKMRFTPTKGAWQDFEMNLADIPQEQLGRLTGEKMTPQAMAKVMRMGVIKSDKKPGPFEVEIDYIAFE